MQQTGRKSPLKKQYNCINATLNGKKKRFLKKICNLSLKELFYSRSCCENAPEEEKNKNETERNNHPRPEPRR